MNGIEHNKRFFYTGGALPPEAPSYILRAADNQLLERLLYGDYCYVLVSRQMGKSSLMVHTLVRLQQRNIMALMVDLNAIGDDTTQEQWYYGLAEHLATQLGLQEEIEAYWNQSAGKTALQKWIGAIEQLLRLYENGALVIFIDEIDQVRSLPFRSDEFFAAIRSFHNRRAIDANFRRLTFCLIGVAVPSDLMEDSRITPFNIAERIDLNDFTEEQVLTLSIGLQYADMQSEALLQRVFYWTNGHPYLTQRLCRAIVEDSAVQTASDVDRLCDRLFFGTDAVTLDDSIDLLSSQLLLSDRDIAGLLSLYQRIVRQKNVRYEKANRLIDGLVIAGVVHSTGGILRIRNRIYARAFDTKWIRDNMPGAEMHRIDEARRKGRIQATAIALPIVLLLCALTILAGFYAYRAQKLTTELQAAVKLPRSHPPKVYPDAASRTPVAVAPEVQGLFNAIEANNLTLAKAYLDGGASPNVIGIDGDTPFYRAAARGRTEILTAMLPFHPDANFVADPRDGGYTPLIVASMLRHVDVIKLLLQLPGIDKNRQDVSGQTALHKACREDPGNLAKLEVVRALVEGGADQSVRDKYGWTAYRHVTSDRAPISIKAQLLASHVLAPQSN